MNAKVGNETMSSIMDVTSADISALAARKSIVEGQRIETKLFAERVKFVSGGRHKIEPKPL
jgi:hypothetical protein